MNVTFSTIKVICKYCGENIAKKITCGHPMCQYKHHIYVMRAVRKTERTCYSRRIEL